MILALFGTNPYPFPRMLNSLCEHAALTGDIVVAQTGHTPSVGNFTCHAFLPHAEVLRLIEQADVVVAQGGYGSLMDCLRLGARTVAVPRLPSLNESVDEQEDLVRALELEGRLIGVYGSSSLSRAIEQVMTLDPPVNSPSLLPSHLAATLRRIRNNVEA